MGEVSPDSEPCAACGTELGGPYCHACGARQVHPRLDERSLLRDFLVTVLNLESRLWRTARDLSWRPGRAVLQYVTGTRSVFVGPLAQPPAVLQADELVISRGLKLPSTAQVFLLRLAGRDHQLATSCWVCWAR